LKVIDYRIEIKSSKDIVRIKPLFDIHAGHRHVDYKKFEHICKEIKNDPNYYAIGGGDYGEFINRKDRRHQESMVANFCLGVDDVAKKQQEYLLDHLEPIKDKFIALLRGNHENTIQKHYGYDIMSRITAGLNAYERYLGFGGFVRLKFFLYGKLTSTFVFYLHHGFGGGRLAGGHALTLQRQFLWNDADVILLGHRHIKHRIEMQVRKPVGSRVLTLQKVAAFCGAFKSDSISNDVTESWEDEKGFPPNSSGGYIVDISPYHKFVRIVED
jgi:hypothetical protein